MADEGDTSAALCLAGSRKITGYETLGNYWLAKLALEGNPEAESRVAHIYNFEKRDPVAAYWYMKSAYKHNTTSQFMLGLMAGAAWERSQRNEFRELNRKWLAASKVYKALKPNRSQQELEVIASQLMPRDTLENRSLTREAFFLSYQ
jgi:TPR repeat protein